MDSNGSVLNYDHKIIKPGSDAVNLNYKKEKQWTSFVQQQEKIITILEI